MERQLFASSASGPRWSPEVYKQAGVSAGYLAAKQAEEEAGDIDDALADALWGTRAQTVLGVTAKLHAILLKAQPSVDSEEFPWPEKRTTIQDLNSLDGHQRGRPTIG